MEISLDVGVSMGAAMVVIPWLYYLMKERAGISGDGRKGQEPAGRGGVSLLSVLLTMSLLPPLYVLYAHLPFAIARQFVAYPLCWVMPMKLLLRSFGNYATDSIPWALASLPNFIASSLIATPLLKGPASAGTYSSLLALLLADLGLLVAALHSLLYIPPSLHYPLHFLGLTSVVSLPARLAAFTMRLDVLPTFDRPLTASSLSDFWSKRWNMTSSELLRHLVYNPVLATLQKRRNDGVLARPLLLPRLIALFSTFLVSGLLHELIWFFSLQGRRSPSWEVLLFFLLHGLLNCAEICIRRSYPELVLRTPASLKLLLTQALIHATFPRLFFGPLVRAHFVSQLSSEYATLLSSARLLTSSA